MTRLTLIGSEQESCTFYPGNSTACPELVHLLKNNVKPVTIEKKRRQRMNNTNTDTQIAEARLIVEQLHHMLHKDALHRLELFQKYASDPDADRWSPDLHQQCELVEALRRKLNNII